ncbi:hypothetical protein TWF696_004331 [Orbilia brochopaga]|uniref:Mitochondrial division protein 1 n=1 Tax=Orbilia brochopaga TaxID=3140254 RepID=A0AAV9V6I2_9PEZI
MDPFSIIASTFTVIDATVNAYKVIQKISGLPKAFEVVNERVPFVKQTLEKAATRLLEDPKPSSEEKAAITAIVKPCQEKIDKLNEIFEKLEKKCSKRSKALPHQSDDKSSEPAKSETILWSKFHGAYYEALAGIKANRVESLMGEILKGIQLLALNQIFKLTMEERLTKIRDGIDEIANVEPSLPDSYFDSVGTIHAEQTVKSGAHGQQNNVQGGKNTFNSVNKTFIQSPQPELQLPIAVDAIFGSAADQYEPQCLPGTRTDVLAKILNWAESPQGECLYWLNGMAGSGKSTICRTICEHLEEKKLLCASFFFRRGGKDRSNATRLFTTLAYQLAVRFPDVRSNVQEAIRLDHTIPHMALDEQLKRLILQPLSKSNFSLPRLLIAIDALDECEEGSDIETIIQLLVQQMKPTGLRVFLTSRPELPIRLGFNEVSGKYRDFVLHEVPSIKSDISLYLKHELEKAWKRRGLPPGWPSDETVGALAKLATPSFIFAATLCRLIGDPDGDGDPTERADAMIRVHYTGDQIQIAEQPDKITGKHAANQLSLRQPDDMLIVYHLTQLNRTYLPVLQQLVNQKSPGHPPKILPEDFNQIVGTVLILFESLPLLSLAYLLSISEPALRHKMKHLHSVISIPKNGRAPVKIFHQSFRDFILGPTLQGMESKFNQFWIDEKSIHKRIALSCIDLMSEVLRTDICSLGSPGKLCSEINKELIDQLIPAELQYTCRYWISHLIRGGEFTKDHIHRVYIFLQEHLLHWLEVMGILGCIFEVIKMIVGLQSKIGDQNKENLAVFLYDIERFVLQTQVLVNNTPLQVYSSGVLFLPESSLVKKHFRPKKVQINTNIQKEWSAHLQTFEGHRAEICGLVISPDGKTIATRSLDQTIKLWNSTTGQLKQNLKFSEPSDGFIDDYGVIFFSPTNKIIASSGSEQEIRNADDGASSPDEITILWLWGLRPSRRNLVYRKTFIKLWDTTTGQLLQKLDPDGNVSAVAFTSDGKTIFSVLKDNTVISWTSATGNRQRTFRLGSSLSYPSGQIQISPDGSQVQQTLKGSPLVLAIGFSPDSKTLASCSQDQIDIWNIEESQVHQTSRMSSPTIISPKQNKGWYHLGDSVQIQGIAISPDGNLIASRYQNTIMIWDKRGRLLQTFKGHRSFIIAMVFSPDGKTIIYGSVDGTIKLWDTTDLLRRSLEWQPDVNRQLGIVPAANIIFSPDGETIASCHDLSGIRLWNPTGQLQRTISKRQREDTFSPDGKILASTRWAGHFPIPGIPSREQDDEFTISLWSTSGHLQQCIKGSYRLIVFSPDGEMIASAPSLVERETGTTTIKVWDTATGQLRRIFNINIPPHDFELKLAWDSSGYLTYGPHSFLVSQTHHNSPAPILVYDQWITRGEEKLLWLPDEYRGPSAVHGNKVAIALESGSVAIISLDLNPAQEY